MTTKQAVPQPVPLPADVSIEEARERALRFAAVSFIEHLAAKSNDFDDVTVEALAYNLQNLMRLFDLPVYTCPIEDGLVRFNRVIKSGDWENGEWKLKWVVNDHQE